MERRAWWSIALLLAVLALALAVRNQVNLHRERQARVADARARPSVDAAAARRRAVLYELLEPVRLRNCRLERFGEPHDGGYLMCANLLGGVQAGYSYGIAGYDQWGCDISTRLDVTVHQYDCFDPTRPVCETGNVVFHDECIAETGRTEDGRRFDSMRGHLARDGHASKRLVVKMDVEGAEWDSLLHAPDDVLEQIDQLAVEFHEVGSEKHVATVRRLRRFFHVAHIHFNNFSCKDGLEPFPAWAYEVLFVSKRLGEADPSRPAGGLHPLDSPNDPNRPDCQPEKGDSPP